MKNKRRAHKKTKTYAQLKKELDRVFSIWVRKRDADENGIGTCISCGTKAAWPQLQAGHFVRRNILATRWHDLNVHSQCYRCNVAMRGNYPEYALALVNKLGKEVLVVLGSLSRQPTKLTRADLQALIVRYSDPIPELRIGQPEQSSG